MVNNYSNFMVIIYGNFITRAKGLFWGKETYQRYQSGIDSFWFQSSFRSEFPGEYDRRVQRGAGHGRRQPDGPDHRRPEEAAHERVPQRTPLEEPGGIRFRSSLDLEQESSKPTTLN